MNKGPAAAARPGRWWPVWTAALLGAPPPTPTDVSFFAPDGATVHARHYPAVPSGDTTVVLFHQTGSNKAEYAVIAPIVASAGCHALAVDLRVGGTMWSHVNETWQARPGATDGFEALQDMSAAVSWAQARGARRVLVWGSSFTAGLVFVLAARRPSDVGGVLAFSPAEYFPERPGAVRSAAARLKVPVFVAAAPHEVDEASAVRRAARGTATLFVAPVAFGHGSGLLGGDRAPFARTQDVWRAMLAFLVPLCRSGGAP